MLSYILLPITHDAPCLLVASLGTGPPTLLASASEPCGLEPAVCSSGVAFRSLRFPNRHAASLFSPCDTTADTAPLVYNAVSRRTALRSAGRFRNRAAALLPGR